MHECVQLVCTHTRRRQAAVSFVFLGDADIQNLNRDYLGHDYPTDVLTFPLGEEGDLEGEIYIGADVAVRQAHDHHVTTREEVVRLAIHGLLHLLGYDDQEPKEAADMHATQEHLVAKWRTTSSQGE